MDTVPTRPHPCRSELDLKWELEKAQQLLAQHEVTAKRRCCCGAPWPCLTADVAADHAACLQACLEALRQEEAAQSHAEPQTQASEGEGMHREAA